MSILFTLDDFTKVEKVTMPWAGETYFIPAGTPMSADGIANDGNAIGILAENARLEYEYDYGTNPYGKVDYTYSVITQGYVNTEDAEASFGGTYSDACRSALSNIVFCDNHKIGGGGGGGGWPSDLPKPSVGGYGYTEQGEQTVIVDNESVTTVAAGGMNYGRFATPFDIVDGAYTVIFNGTEYNLNSTFIEETGVYLIGETTETGYDFSDYPFIIANMNGMTILLTESVGDYEITVKTESETIHKINDKFYESTVEFTIDQRDEEREPESDLYGKCINAMNSGKNVRLRIINEYGDETLYPILAGINKGNYSVSFARISNGTDGFIFSIAEFGVNDHLKIVTRVLY